jgi:hypothetical protein
VQGYQPGVLGIIDTGDIKVIEVLWVSGILEL